MYCQFEQLKERNVHVRCFNQALYHVQSAENDKHNYCALHIQRLPRRTKLELLFDVIELPPSLSTSQLVVAPQPSQRDSNNIIQSSAGLVTSNNASLASHERDMNLNSSDVQVLNVTDTQDSHGEARAYKSKSEYSRPFKHLGELCECYGYLPRPKTWRMLPYAIPGEIHALPNTRGFALATNGIHVAIENFEYKELFIGHLDYFVIDDLRAPAGALNTLNQAAENSFRVVKNNLKQFDELFD